MSGAIRVREARHGDELAVARLHVRSWQEAYEGLMPAEFLAALDPRERAARYAFGAGPDAPVTLLALAGGDDGAETIAGFATFGASRDEDARGLGEVHALYVDPDRVRGGVGRLLMAEVRGRLREAGFPAAILWVLRGNQRAAAFYEREGWSRDGATRVEQPYGIVSTVERFRRALP